MEFFSTNSPGPKSRHASKSEMLNRNLGLPLNSIQPNHDILSYLHDSPHQPPIDFVLFQQPGMNGTSVNNSNAFLPTNQSVRHCPASFYSPIAPGQGAGHHWGSLDQEFQSQHLRCTRLPSVGISLVRP